MASSTPFSSSIGKKLLIRVLVVSLAPLVILSMAVYVGLARLDTSATTRVDESRDILADESVAVISQDSVKSMADEINVILLERISDVGDWSRNPVVSDAIADAETFARVENLDELSIEELEARFTEFKSTGVAFDAQTYLQDELGRKPDFREVFFTDSNGFNTALTSLTSDFVQSDEEWWQEAWETGQSISNVEYDESAQIFSIDISVRIDNRFTGRPLGVMKAVLSVSFVQSIADTRAESGIDYAIALSDGRLIAETSSGHDENRMMSDELSADQISAGLVAALDAGATGSIAEEDFFYGYTSTLDPELFSSAAGDFEGFDWVVVSAQSTEAAFAPLAGLEDLRKDISDSGQSLRVTVVVLLLIGLGAAIIMSQLISRGIVGPIRKLTELASNAATLHLPGAVRSIDEGARDDEITVPRIQLRTGDELEGLASSFNSVQGTALNLAVDQAKTRRTTGEMFVNLGRRNHSLLKRQLRFIDGLERSETDPDTLDALFKLDHLATRMRRNAESLLVLAGERSPRRWSAPVEMRSAVQAALAEVEQYERVDLSGMGDGSLQGNVVADLAHIVAELLENALNFSPPHAQVTVSGHSTVHGYTISIEDDGLGMPAEELAEANERLKGYADLSDVPSQYLGLFVVGRLAREHDLGVILSTSSSGGTVATIKVPTALVPDPDGEEAGDSDSAASQDAAAQEATPQDDASGKRDAEVDEDVEVDLDAAVEVMADQSDAEDVEVESDESESEDESAVVVVDDEPAAAEANDGPAVRAGDDESDPAVERRRGPDAQGSVEIDGVSFPRRGGPDRGPKRRSTDPQGDADQADESPSDTTTDPGSPEPAVSEAGGTAAGERTDLESFGLTRRASSGEKKPLSKTKAKAKAKTMAAPAKGDEADATVEAEAQKSQWSSFQRGKDAAESDPGDDA